MSKGNQWSGSVGRVTAIDIEDDTHSIRMPKRAVKICGN